MITITTTTTSKQTPMTLKEVSNFLKQCVDAGLDMDTELKARIGWQGQLYQISTTEKDTSK